MSRETKFGYGFLLVGSTLTYLIDALLGHTAALVCYAAFFLIGICFLISAHLPESKETRERYSVIAKIVMLLIATAALVTLAISIERVIPKDRKTSSTSAPSEEPSKPSAENAVPSSTVSKPDPDSVRVETGIAMGRIERLPISELLDCSGLTCLEEESVTGRPLSLSFHGGSRVTIAILVKVYVVGTNAEFLPEPRIDVSTSAKDVGLSYQGQPMNPPRNRVEFSSILLYPTSQEHAPYGFLVDIELRAPIETFALTITVRGQNMKRHSTSVNFIVADAKTF